MNSSSNKNGAKGAVGPGEPAVSEKHWTSVKFSNDMLMDALFKHVLNLMAYGMSDLGEVLEAVSQISESDEESWIDVWSDLARRLQARAEEAEQNGKTVSAASACLRASTYWRVSLMYFSRTEDPRIRKNVKAGSECYEKYLALSGYPGRYVEIPYENSFLPGHFYRSPAAKENSPLLIITPGRDTWAEDTRWVYDGALHRGISCLVYDGPGQGYALRLNGLCFRPDWENVVGPVIDYALGLPGIDPERIGLMGLSFGGFLVPRAAAFDKRVKVCVADPGNLSWGDSIIHNLQSVSDLPPEQFPPALACLVRDYAWKHGVPNTVGDVIEALRAYDNTAIVDRISCETLVMDGTAEIIQGQGKRLFDALNCPKGYMLFDETTTAQAHTQMGGYATATEYLFDWLDDKL